MSKRKSSGPTNRNLFNHGTGKGDKDRTTNVIAYNENLSEVKFSGVPASQDPEFENMGGKSVKRYGTPPPLTLYEVFTSKPVIH